MEKQANAEDCACGAFQQRADDFIQNNIMNPDEWEENRQLQLEQKAKSCPTLRKKLSHFEEARSSERSQQTLKIQIVKRKYKKICRICAEGFQHKAEYWAHVLECMHLIQRLPKPHHLHLQLLLKRYLDTPAEYYIGEMF